jgi:hypothetical protein
MPLAWESLFEGSLTLSAAQTEIDAFAELPARRGVLLFTDADSRPIQLLQTANLRGLSRSRLADTEEQVLRRKADLGAITQRIYYACCDNDLERHFLYQRLTHAVFGKGWKKWLALPRREYAAIDRGRAFPYFSITGNVESAERSELFGPFPTRRAAAHFCDCLNTAFELCRNPAFWDSGKAQSCPYRQMQSCHGLCCQEHGEKVYSELVRRGIRCAEGGVNEAIAEFERQMKQAAADLQFEAAQLRKKQAERLKELLRPDFAWTGRLAELSILFIDRGPKIAPEGTKKKVRHYQVWRIDADAATCQGTFAEAEQLHILLHDQPVQPPYPYAQSRQEHLATVGYFLYRKSRPGLWYNAAKALPDAERILAELSEPHSVKSEE